MIWKKLLIVSCLLLIVGLNFYLYRGEFKVLVDPNDNIFQYALVDEARTIWKNIFSGKISPRQTWLAPFYLLDSWQERWAEGFALSSYYSHLPQAVIGLFGGFKLFVTIRTLMLVLLPLMFFWGGTILRLPAGFSLILALFSQSIFTDGLYGIDVSSFIFRGWGLSAQLMAVFFLPQAFAYAVEYFENPTSHKASLGKAVFFNFLVASSHFGIFSLLLLGYPIYLLVKMWEVGGGNLDNEVGSWKEIAFRIGLFIFSTLFSLSYFIIPFFLQSQYRNFSVWDPIWKFDSWGARQTIIWALNGELFDFGRFPFITLTVIFGVFLGLAGKNKLFKFLSLLFIFYTVLFLGRTTLGPIIDFIPGFSEYHLHRIIVMVQFTGILLGAWFLYKLIKKLDTVFFAHGTPPRQTRSLPEELKTGIYAFLILFLVFFLEKPLINYVKDNNAWIERSNKAYLNDLPDYEKIKMRLASLPKARVYMGRPGNWGKQFTVGETPLYMALSQDGYPVIGFLPESWSPNSDPEQFFADDNIDFYNLYNVGYSIMPADIKAPDFAKLIAKEGKYLLYQIKTNGWFDVGVSTIAVKSKKTDLLSVTRLWFASDSFKMGDYPMIDLSKGLPDGKRWYIEMSDRNNFINLNDGKERNIWKANPFLAKITIVDRSTQNGNTLVKNQAVLVNGYKTNIEVKKDCMNCLLILKQSFHPNWEVRMNGEKVRAVSVFPFYIGIPIEKSGSFEVVAEYKPSSLKIILIFLEIGVLAIFVGKKFRERFLRTV